MKFKIYYPKDHEDESKQGKRYNPPAHAMVVMKEHGTFFLYHGDEYYPWIQLLHQVLPKFDVVWSE